MFPPNICQRCVIYRSKNVRIWLTCELIQVYPFQLSFTHSLIPWLTYLRENTITGADKDRKDKTPPSSSWDCKQLKWNIQDANVVVSFWKNYPLRWLRAKNIDQRAQLKRGDGILSISRIILSPTLQTTSRWRWSVWSTDWANWSLSLQSRKEETLRFEKAEREKISGVKRQKGKTEEERCAVCFAMVQLLLELREGFHDQMFPNIGIA